MKLSQGVEWALHCALALAQSGPGAVASRRSLAGCFDLPEAGYAYLAGAAPGHGARVREVFVDVLTPDELRTLHRISDKVLARIEHPEGRTMGG